MLNKGLFLMNIYNFASVKWPAKNQCKMSILLNTTT